MTSSEIIGSNKLYTCLIAISIFRCEVTFNSRHVRQFSRIMLMVYINFNNSGLWPPRAIFNEWEKPADFAVCRFT